MSKSVGNYIGIDEAPAVIFTKVLNIPDSAMRSYAELVTRWSQAAIDRRFRELEQGASNMRTFKHDLAREIVSIFHGDEAADQAADDAAKMHQGEAPSDTPVFRLSAAQNIVDLLHAADMIKSKSEGRRLVQQGGVRIDGATITDIDHVISVDGKLEKIVQVGKRKFIRVVSM